MTERHHTQVQMQVFLGHQEGFVPALVEAPMTDQ